jgi:hypothetical protein
MRKVLLFCHVCGVWLVLLRSCGCCIKKVKLAQVTLAFAISPSNFLSGTLEQMTWFSKHIWKKTSLIFFQKKTTMVVLWKARQEGVSVGIQEGWVWALKRGECGHMMHVRPRNAITLEKVWLQFYEKFQRLQYLIQAVTSKITSHRSMTKNSLFNEKYPRFY